MQGRESVGTGMTMNGTGDDDGGGDLPCFASSSLSSSSSSILARKARALLRLRRRRRRRRRARDGGNDSRDDDDDELCLASLVLLSRASSSSLAAEKAKEEEEEDVIRKVLIEEHHTPTTAAAAAANRGRDGGDGDNDGPKTTLLWFACRLIREYNESHRRRRRVRSLGVLDEDGGGGDGGGGDVTEGKEANDKEDERAVMVRLSLAVRVLCLAYAPSPSSASSSSSTLREVERRVVPLLPPLLTTALNIRSTIATAEGDDASDEEGIGGGGSGAVAAMAVQTVDVELVAALRGILLLLLHRWSTVTDADATGEGVATATTSLSLLEMWDDAATASVRRWFSSLVASSASRPSLQRERRRRRGRQRIVEKKPTAVAREEDDDDMQRECNRKDDRKDDQSAANKVIRSILRTPLDAHDDDDDDYGPDYRNGRKDGDNNDIDDDGPAAKATVAPPQQQRLLRAATVLLLRSHLDALSVMSSPSLSLNGIARGGGRGGGIGRNLLFNIVEMALSLKRIRPARRDGGCTSEEEGGSEDDDEVETGNVVDEDEERSEWTILALLYLLRCRCSAMDESDDDQGDDDGGRGSKMGNVRRGADASTTCSRTDFDLVRALVGGAGTHRVGGVVRDEEMARSIRTLLVAQLLLPPALSSGNSGGDGESGGGVGSDDAAVRSMTYGALATILELCGVRWMMLSHPPGRDGVDNSSGSGSGSGDDKLGPLGVASEFCAAVRLAAGELRLSLGRILDSSSSSSSSKRDNAERIVMIRHCSRVVLAAFRAMVATADALDDDEGKGADGDCSGVGGTDPQWSLDGSCKAHAILHIRSSLDDALNAAVQYLSDDAIVGDAPALDAVGTSVGENIRVEDRFLEIGVAEKEATTMHLPLDPVKEEAGILCSRVVGCFLTEVDVFEEGGMERRTHGLSSVAMLRAMRTSVVLCHRRGVRLQIGSVRGGAKLGSDPCGFEPKSGDLSGDEPLLSLLPAVVSILSSCQSGNDAEKQISDVTMHFTKGGVLVSAMSSFLDRLVSISSPQDTSSEEKFSYSGPEIFSSLSWCCLAIEELCKIDTPLTGCCIISVDERVSLCCPILLWVQRLMAAVKESSSKSSSGLGADDKDLIAQHLDALNQVLECWMNLQLDFGGTTGEKHETVPFGEEAGAGRRLIHDAIQLCLSCGLTQNQHMHTV